MTLKPDVRGVATQFGLDPLLIQAVDTAEGNLLAAVQCSIPSVQTREKALDVTCRSAVHALCDFVKRDPATARAFVDFWGARWAPVGAANDPAHLNANWPINVKKLWGIA